MDTVPYLAYGSNLHPARIGARLDSITTLGTVELPGWAVHYHKSSADGSGKCNLTPAASGTAYAAVYEISLADKARLDHIEGVGNGYRSTCIDVEIFGTVWVYLAEESYIDDRLVPYDWYRAFVVEGARHHRFPAPYVDKLGAIGAACDPDDARRSANWALLGSVADP